ncbi:redoxin domain-containing protein [Paenibacillus apiarius]|uniref:redoxin domain-containing protein n=1 Tax=Paenibacillus apiarius TaxID=46240 RepID=UPI003B3B3E11
MTDLILITTLILVLAQLWLVFMLARLIGQFLAKIRSIGGITLTGLQIGEQVPLFREWNSKREKVILKELLSQNKVLLLFISTTCQTCKSILPELKKVVANLDLKIVVINTDKHSNDDNILEVLPSGIEYIRSPEVMESYDVSRVPYAFMVNQEGILEYHSPLSSFNALWGLLANENRSNDNKIIS